MTAPAVPDLSGLDFAAIANAVNQGGRGPGSYAELFKTIHNSAEPRGASDDPAAARQEAVKYIARSALLMMPADLDKYNKVLQDSLEGRALLRHDVQNFDSLGTLRIWLVWVDVIEEPLVPPAPKT